MSKADSLVSWSSPEEKGKIPGSDWMCPTDSVKPLGEIEGRGGVITDEIIRMHAGGRPQHLEMVEFPEGYVAAKVVDSETGRVLTDSDSTYRYAGRLSCNCGAIHNCAMVTSVLQYRPIGLAEDRELASVYNFTNGTQTVVKPSEVPKKDPDYISRLRTSMHITPNSHSLYMSTEGAISAIDNVHAKLEVREDSSKATGELVVWLANDWDSIGQLNLELNGKGQIEKLKACKGGLLKMLGLKIDLDFNPENGYWRTIVSSKQRAQVLDATAEALGLGSKWQGLDLKQTASSLYAAMGRRNLDPTTVLVPQS